MNHLDIVQQMAGRYPSLLEGVNDDARRTFTRRVAETLKARFPAEGWAHKSASASRPPSKDAVVDGEMRYYDILVASGTAHPRPSWNVGSLIPNQHRIEVPAHDWLAAVPSASPSTPPDDDLAADVLELQADVAQLQEAVSGLLKTVASLCDRVTALEAAPSVTVNTSRVLGHAHQVVVP